jgi:acetyl-CoA carboxylase biotin carboxyl carrier protein
MDIEKIRELLKLVEESGIAEIEINEGDDSVRIARVLPSNQTVMAPQAMPPQYVMSGDAQPPSGEAAPASAAPETDLPEGHVISAPMVGTFYSSPSPDSPAFVAVGTEVSEGATLCIIEAMKVMNQIEADKSGKISAVLVENGQPVEFGQPLFVIS